ncbi:MAG: hypothetical protein KDB79_16195 [Acidobacteria bacterium]|nr:hypothetical protein [Acidobacteriota bacterium]
MIKNVVCKASPVREKSLLPFQNDRHQTVCNSTLEIIPLSPENPYQVTISKHVKINLNYGDKIKSLAGTTAVWLECGTISRTFLLSPESTNSTDLKCRTEIEIGEDLKCVS